MSRTVSIIVPIYNVEKYLSRCLDSILAQTYRDFELILIDDGSPDRCGEIIDAYALRDERIVVIHQENRGVSAARNAGIGVARGEYLSFVDPDDYVSEDFLQVLVDGMGYEDVDIACCNWDSFSDTQSFEHNVSIPSGIMDRDEWIGHIFDIPRTIGGSNCNKMFRRSVMKYAYDETLRIGEDRMYLIQNSLNIRRIFYTNCPKYHIYERPDSSIRADETRLIEGLYTEEKIFELVKNESKSIRDKSEADLLDTAVRMFNLCRTKAPDKAKYARTVLKKHIGEHFLKVVCNREIKWKEKALFLLYISGIK